jgi:hypothetical protein
MCKSIHLTGISLFIMDKHKTPTKTDMDETKKLSIGLFPKILSVSFGLFSGTFGLFSVPFGFSLNRKILGFLGFRGSHPMEVTQC